MQGAVCTAGAIAVTLPLLLLTRVPRVRRGPGTQPMLGNAGPLAAVWVRG